MKKIKYKREKVFYYLKELNRYLDNRTFEVLTIADIKRKQRV